MRALSAKWKRETSCFSRKIFFDNLAQNTEKQNKPTYMEMT